ncbi:MAG: cbb3-type cytochrome c oxidase subunit I [Flavobacteriales bacterium]|nr:cbb3-type cytochrome c oxidase subunit I [Flavobacteriales bacterium]
MKRLRLPVLLFGITGMVILLWACITSISSSTSLGPIRTIGATYLADSALDIPIHDTYYVIAWRQAWLVLAILFLAFAFAYWLYERLTSRRPNKALGMIHFISTVLLPLVFGPVHFITANATVPHRYYDYSSFPMFDGALDLSALVTAFTLIAVIGQLAFLLNLIWYSERPISAPK